ncbi:MAG: DUF819 family protein [Candidatus Aminicenantes bacterium]|nr:DUF819 family protein [Candidatus Aminicenantes bacterium]
MIYTIIQILFILLFPALAIYLKGRSKFFAWLSPIIICFIAGIALANSGLRLDTGLLTTITEVSIALAIPVLLFSSDFLAWLKQAKMTLLSYSLGVISILVSSTTAYFLFRHSLDQADAVAGMLTGVYTGGTPNMSAVGIALGVKEETFILLNSADVVNGAVYFLLLITVVRPFLGLFLPHFKKTVTHTDKWKQLDAAFMKLSLPRKGVHIGAALGLAVVIFAIAAGISILLKGELVAPLFILGITTLGIAASFFPFIKKLTANYPTAEYLLFVFSTAMGALVNLKNMVAASGSLFLFYTIAMWGAVFLHIILGAIFRIDRDTLIITSTAGIYGPAFIGPVADGIGNRDVIVPGIAMGLLGYAIGNYLGLALAWILP